MAFPLISAGVYGWPLDDAVAAAVDTVTDALARDPSGGPEVTFVAFSSGTEEMLAERVGAL